MLSRRTSQHGCLGIRVTRSLETWRPQFLSFSLLSKYSFLGVPATLHLWQLWMLQTPKIWRYDEEGLSEIQL
ncbi:hypothetical protein BDA96_09G079500 [Sorghum bicolor]|uniref:Uncharacterized protein n=2 Tax=Sorghum bicolor TaxID=4558 RepID=A0A1Z5R1J0_SORBI|nr:hypothetical protein BDA96_09G079500 [Sorghum bicolor]OQU77599.1 hypothetical protein SORBI_3009G075201 [Sorghum bicolor]OQU77600.1 hypothetical protein SORBI_3009G075201 [Sorghum bicolor]